MSLKKEIGEISKGKDHEVDWTIKEFKNTFPDEMKDEYCFSPEFDVSGSKWYLKIYPNGQARNNSIGCSELYLLRGDRGAPPLGANFKFGVKKEDGGVEYVGNDLNWLFDKDDTGLGKCEFLKRSELEQKYLATSGDLTITCTLRVIDLKSAKNKSFDSTAGVDTLRQKLAHLYESKGYSDATLKVKDKEFKVHKWVLADQSSVFHNIFEKATKMNTDVFDFSECNPDTFEKFLKYLYLGKAETGNMWSDGSFLELTKIADKFEINGMRSDCIISLMSDLNAENVCQVAALACSIGDRPLEIKCQDFFNENGGEIVSTPEWEAFVKDNSLLACKLLTNMLKEMKTKK